MILLQEKHEGQIRVLLSPHSQPESVLESSDKETKIHRHCFPVREA